MFTGIDIETNGLDFHRNKMLGVAVGSTYYYELMKFVVPDSTVFHNGKFDLKFLHATCPVKIPYTFDTMLAASALIDKPESLSLDSLARHYLQIDTWKSLDRKKMESYSPEEVASYCLTDVRHTEHLGSVLHDRLTKEGSLEFFQEKLMPAARLLLCVELRGMGFDVNAAKTKRTKLTDDLSKLEFALNNLAGEHTNWRSPKQVTVALNKKGLYPTSFNWKERAMKSSTNEEALLPLRSHEIVKLLLQHRSLTKLDGYLESWIEASFNGRIYPTYNLSNTRTGRLSCSEPNLQQVPAEKDVRALFIPTPGKVFVIADFAQIEPRVIAHYSQDEALLEVFRSGLDLYGDFAVKVLGVNCHPNEVKRLHPDKRKVAKTAVLSIFYGIGAKKLAAQIKKDCGIDLSEREVRHIINDTFNTYKGVKALRQRIDATVATQGYLKNHYGRKVKVEHNQCHLTGLNSLVQSTASDALLFSMLKVTGGDLIALIHDVCIFECDPANALTFVQQLNTILTEQGISCPLKLDAVVGSSWADKN